MTRPEEYRATVKAELSAPAVSAQVLQFLTTDAADIVVRHEDVYRFYLCLTPRPRDARASYLHRWNSQRFERLGNVFLVPPGEEVLTRSDEPCSQSTLICRIDPHAVGTWFEGEMEWNNPCLAAGLDVRNNNVRGLLLRLAEEARHPGFASATMTELIGTQLALELNRYYRGLSQTHTAGGLASWRLRLIEDRLRQIAQAPSLIELAELCQLSVRQLTRGFRVSRGCSIGEYIANNQIEQAKDLLATDQCIKSISYSLGFATPSSFSYAFRRATGRTPRQFRSDLFGA